MNRRKVGMKKIRTALYMKWSLKRTNREIAISIGVSSSTISDCLGRAKFTQLSWPLPEELDDDALEQLLYPPNKRLSVIERGEVDWAYIHKEYKRKGVTLQLLWLEYKENNPQGYRYAQFCNLYRDYIGQFDLWMRQTHKAGDKLFIDYAGFTITVNSKDGQFEAQIFVAVLGASGYVYAEATRSQSLPDWIASHCRAFIYFQGVPALLVPDNLKSGVKKAHRYDPESNPTYQEMAQHYNTAIMPARVRAPKDKAKAEQSVGQIECQILAALRNHQFFSLSELNEEIHQRLIQLNEKPFQKLPGSRKSLYEELDRPTLMPLPQI